MAHSPVLGMAEVQCHIQSMGRHLIPQVLKGKTMDGSVAISMATSLLQHPGRTSAGAELGVSDLDFCTVPSGCCLLGALCPHRLLLRPRWISMTLSMILLCLGINGQIHLAACDMCLIDEVFQRIDSVSCQLSNQIKRVCFQVIDFREWNMKIKRWGNPATRCCATCPQRPQNSWSLRRNPSVPRPPPPPPPAPGRAVPVGVAGYGEFFAGSVENMVETKAFWKIFTMNCRSPSWASWLSTTPSYWSCTMRSKWHHAIADRKTWQQIWGISYFTLWLSKSMPIIPTVHRWDIFFGVDVVGAGIVGKWYWDGYLTGAYWCPSGMGKDYRLWTAVFDRVAHECHRFGFFEVWPCRLDWLTGKLWGYHERVNYGKFVFWLLGLNQFQNSKLPATS